MKDKINSTFNKNNKPQDKAFNLSKKLETIFKVNNPMENLNIKIYLIWKICMLKQLKKNSNLINNRQLTIIIKDGYGCSSHGYVWLWNQITLINWENVSLRQLHTCLYQNKDNSLFKLWRSHYKLRKRNKQFYKKVTNYLQKVQLEKLPFVILPKRWTIRQD